MWVGMNWEGIKEKEIKDRRMCGFGLVEEGLIDTEASDLFSILFGT